MTTKGQESVEQAQCLKCRNPLVYGKCQPQSCASCKAYEDRLEEIRMAVSLDRTEKNPYGRTTIEYAIWEQRHTIDRLRKQNSHDRKQWKHEVFEQRKLRRAAERKLKTYDPRLETRHATQQVPAL